MRRLLIAASVGALAMIGLATCGQAGSTSVSSGSPPALAAGQTAMVTYCDHQQARITEPAELHGRSPAVVYVHGGSWVSGNLNTGGFLIKRLGPALAAKGFVVVSIDYRLGPSAQWPSQIEDVKCAVRYLRANARALNIDPGEIGAWGQSAGGHLVALLGTAPPSAGWDVGPYTSQSSRVQAVVDMAGISDLLTMGSQGASGLVQDSFISLLATTPAGELAGVLTKDSPVTYVRPDDPPFLILASTNDRIVYPQQSQELSWDLAANGDSHQLVMVNGGGHEFDEAGESPDEFQITSLVVDFFVQHLQART